MVLLRWWRKEKRRINARMPRCLDPRISNDRDDKRETQNPVLVMTKLSRQLYSEREIDWEKVAQDADAFDLRPHNQPGK